MEGNQRANHERLGHHSVGRHGAAGNRPAHVCGVGGGARFDAEGQTVATRKAMVDGGPNTSPSDIQVDPKTTETRKPDGHPLGTNQREESIVGPGEGAGRGRDARGRYPTSNRSPECSRPP
ncbi:hypothetical protein DTO027I6_9774 [Penicillium roqueforti]|nr:hypothetical protein CBS147337_9829 [Penicillium roqueforti]KAI3185345.1 hypothetical protein DTO027I6_9774 [Penicillium roqueforti]